MNSLFIFNDFPPILGGQSTYFYYTCKAMPSDKIIVLAPKWKGDGEFDNAQDFRIIRKPYLTTIPLLEKAVKIILPMFYALSIIKREKIQVIHCAHVLSIVLGLFSRT